MYFYNFISITTAQQSQQASPTLTRSIPEYKKMNGSIDSMDKSQFNSSLDEDSPTYDLYEINNQPSSTGVPMNKLDLSFQNKGMK